MSRRMTAYINFAGKAKLVRDALRVKNAGEHNSDADAESPIIIQEKNNTIIQQIRNFSLVPMNDKQAVQTIDDHKYLLELAENKVAIAFFAMANRNQSLFNALSNYVQE